MRYPRMQARSVDVAGSKRREGRFDDGQFFVAESAAFARVRVQSEHENAGSGDAEASSEFRACDRGDALDPLAVSVSATARSGRCVVTSATRREPLQSIMTACSLPVSSARNSRMTRERHAALAYDAFVNWGGHERIALALHAETRAGFEQFKYVVCVAGIESTGDHGAPRGDRQQLHRATPMRHDVLCTGKVFEADIEAELA